MSKSVVVDTSLAVKWVIDEIYAAEAIALYHEWIRKNIQILAPALLPIEAASVVYKRVRRGILTIEDAHQALIALLLTDLVFHQNPALSVQALEVADHYNLPSTYDGHYIALAEHYACECWTADERLWNAVKGRIPWVRWIGDYRAGSV